MISLVEAIAAINLLLTLSSKGANIDNDINSVWSALDAKKAHFTNEKFLATAPHEGLLEIYRKCFIFPSCICILC